MHLKAVKGKKSYGYLPKPQKKFVDRIVDEMERLPSVRDCYDQWTLLQGKVDGYYHDKPREMKFLTPEEIQRLLIQAREDGCYELLLLELSIGLRRVRSAPSSGMT